ncbi:MAG: hypothetical protein L0I24_11500 [Pseudonocardia sp.]|nr:hypothetical protein [Pseudonocardia sp.]
MVGIVVLGYVAVQNDGTFDWFDRTVLNREAFTVEQIADVTLGDSEFLPVVFPEPLTPSEMVALGHYESYWPLLRDEGAVPLGAAPAGYRLTGERHAGVVIERIAARVVDTRPAPRAVIIGKPEIGGGPSDKILLGFDLDEPRPLARVFEGGTLGDLFSSDNYITLERGESLLFTFVGTTDQPVAHRWLVDVTYSSGGQESVTVTLPADAPFEVAGAVTDYPTAFRPTVGTERPTPVPSAELCGGSCVGYR